MIGTTETTTRPPAGSWVARKAEALPPLWRRLALGIVLLISVFMNFFQLGQNGFGNLYYASAIRSMLDNLHNFFFVSFDPGGYVTIDKPPLGFWLQTISAKIFGFTAFSVLLPQALAGVLSVLLLYHLVRRHFGAVAGLLAGLALALSPISVVTNRNNTIDSTLTLVMLLGAWAVMRAAETGRLRWLLACAACIGLGFNIKMLEAYLVIPAFGLLYLLAAPKGLWTRIWHLALATLLLLTISLSWAVAVDLTPASARPYVGSSQDNSEVSLALGYNGISRLLGQFGGGLFGGGQHSFNGARGSTATSSQTGTSSSSSSTTSTPSSEGQPPSAIGGQPGQPPAGSNAQSQPPSTASGQPPSGAPSSQPGSSTTPSSGTSSGTSTTAPGGFPGGNPPTGFPGGNAGGGLGGNSGMFDTGIAGPFRLFNVPLAGQIGWLLPLAIMGMIALACQRRLRFRDDRPQQSLVVWGVWLLTMGIFFSVAGFFHPYYLTVMAPAVAALFGIGLVVMWQDFRQPGWRGWLLPVAIIATAAEQIHILASYPAWSEWLTPLILVLCAITVCVLVAFRLDRRRLQASVAPRLNLRTLIPVLSLGVLALLIAPAVWGGIPVIENQSVQLPEAGPTQDNGFGGIGGNGGGTTDTALIRYLEANQGNATYLVATPSSNTADSIILATNKPVMALGGFSGSDPILTTSQLAKLVSQGTVRFFLIDGFGGGGRGNTADGQIPSQILDRIPAQYRDLIQEAMKNGGLPGAGGPGGQSSLTSWVTQHCKTVSSSAWQTSSQSSSTPGSAGGQLYDCQAAS